MNGILNQITPEILEKSALRRSQTTTPVHLYLPMEYGSWIASTSVRDTGPMGAEYPASELYFSPGLTRGRVDSSGI